MRNLLEEFHRHHGIRPPTILGVREHVFTGRYFHRILIYFKSHSLTIFPLNIYFQRNFCIDVQCLFFSLIYVQSRK